MGQCFLLNPLLAPEQSKWNRVLSASSMVKLGTGSGFEMTIDSPVCIPVVSNVDSPNWAAELDDVLGNECVIRAKRWFEVKREDRSAS